MKISVDQFTYHDYPDKKMVVIEKLTPSEMAYTWTYIEKYDGFLMEGYPYKLDVIEKGNNDIGLGLSIIVKYK